LFPTPSRFVERATVQTSVFVSGSSDIGQVRRRNEDAIALLPEHGVAVVADGMGGHPGGDVASRIAADFTARALGQAVHGRGRSEDFTGALLPVVERTVLEAHERIRARGAQEPELSGMGTTLTAMIVDGESRAYVIGHVGDSRAYRLRGGALEQLTRDDTWVQQQIDNGVLQPSAARNSPYAHLLTQCLGLEDPPVPQIVGGRAEPGDLYLLCTDGLVGSLDEAEMFALLEARASSVGANDGAVAALVEAANRAGGYDNITAALIRISGSPA
jgi:serine/threonine protein phosphatase PrpC